MRRIVLSLGVGVALLAPPALAQQPPGCSDFKWPVDRELAAFASDAAPAVESVAPLPTAAAATLKLADQGGVSFTVPPVHKPKHGPAYAGSFVLPAGMAAGPYQVTLSDDAWIDVAQGGKLLKQTGFTGSHTCTVVRKSVRFDLAAGPATLEISDSTKDSVKVEVLPAAGP